MLFAGLMLFLALKIKSRIDQKNEISERIRTIPNFSYQHMDGSTFTNENLRGNTAAIFIHYDSQCGYCDAEAQMIQKSIRQFAEVEIIFISFEKPAEIRKFAQKHRLASYGNVHFLYDPKASFSATFDSSSLPSIILYDKKQKLVEKIKGQTDPEFLLRKLNLKQPL